MNTASFLGFWSPSEEVANALAQFLHDSNPWVVGNTLVSLNRLGPKYIRQHLLPVTNLLTSPHPDLRENAQRILAKLNDSLAEPP